MASPEKPKLASAIYMESNVSNVTQDGEEHQRVSTDCDAINKLLDGGLQYGRVYCINGEAESGTRELCQAFLVSHLLSSPDASATLIDSSHAFDVRTLRRAVAFEAKDQIDPAQRTKEVLDSVSIMKVFDFAGLEEGVSELKKTLESEASPSPAPIKQQRASSAEIGDSEDDGEMLDKHSPRLGTSQSSQASVRHEAHSQKRLLLIDSISYVALPMIKNQHTSGHARLAHLAQSINCITKTHSLCTILLNGVTARTNNGDESPSMFKTCAFRPALGAALSHVLDADLLIHQIPRPSVAEQVCSRTGEQILGLQRSGGLVSVMEMLQDRHAEDTDHCARFTFDDVGRLVDVI